MAEVQQSAPARGSKRRSKKIPFRLDMTPMVDLAFLLLTFFMLTTTFAKPNVMRLSMPHDVPAKTDVSESKAMTIILGQHHRVHYFFGLNAPTDPTVAIPRLQTTTFGANGIRQVLLQRQRQRHQPVVLIKSGKDAKYQDMVDILDEMNITNQQQYALVTTTQADLDLVQQATR